MIRNTHITSYTTTYGLTQAEAKEHLNILDTSFDDLIDGYIAAAHVYLYQETNILIDGVLKGYMSGIADFDIPYGPIDSIALYYYDANDDRTLMSSDDYNLIQGKIALLEYTGTEPTSYDREFPYEVEVTTTTNSDPMVKQCLRMLVADMFENRQTNVVGASVNREVSRATSYQITLVSLRTEL